MAPPLPPSPVRLLAAVACLVVAGCGNPGFQDEAGSPGMPPLGTLCTDVECAGAFVEYFLGMEGDAVRGEDGGMWEKLSLPTCEYCLDTLLVREENEASGFTVSGGGYESVQFEMAVDGNDPSLEVEADTGGAPTFMFVVLAEHQTFTYTYPDGTSATVPSEWVTIWIGVQWNGSYWQVMRIGIT